MDNQPNNPLHGVKLAEIVEHLVDTYGWDELGFKIQINCFNSNPSIKSSLKFLRKTVWAREKVERLYLRSIGAKLPPRKPREAVERKPVQREVVERSVEECSSEVPDDSPWAAAVAKIRERGTGSTE